jgi:hypothetical protein
MGVCGVLLTFDQPGKEKYDLYLECGYGLSPEKAI